MAKLFLTENHVINKNGKQILLDQREYNLSDDKLAEENEFFQCSKCKNYFDSVSQFGQYHPLHEKYGEKIFCYECFSIVNK